jgi:hypothetical protein
MEKSGTTFPVHTQKRHFLWNYIYYLIVLENKDQTDYTGIEFDINCQVENEEIDWFPSMGEGDAEEELKTAFKALEAEMATVFEALEDSVGKIKPTV